MQPASSKDRVERRGVFSLRHTGMKLQHQLSWELDVAITIPTNWLLDMNFFGPSGGHNGILM